MTVIDYCARGCMVRNGTNTAAFVGPKDSRSTRWPDTGSKRVNLPSVREISLNGCCEPIFRAVRSLANARSAPRKNPCSPVTVVSSLPVSPSITATPPSARSSKRSSRSVIVAAASWSGPLPVMRTRATAPMVKVSKEATHQSTQRGNESGLMAGAASGKAVLVMVIKQVFWLSCWSN